MSWKDIDFLRKPPSASHDNYHYKLVGGGTGTNIATSTVYLPKELIWQDEFSWEPVAQTYEYSVEGNLLIQESTKKKGRHITLVGQNDTAWIDREDMKKLVDLRNVAGLKMTLTFESIPTVDNNSITKYSEYTVMFRHQDTALEYTLVRNFDQYETDALYIINAIRFMEVLPNVTQSDDTTGD